MSIEDEKLSKQMIAARAAMYRYRDALSALAGNEISAELCQEIETARERIAKYRTRYRTSSESSE